MKSIIGILFLVSTCSNVSLQREHKFKILIWDTNNSMAYSARYLVNNDSLTISFISGIEGETSKDILNRILTKNEKDRIVKFLLSFPIDTISSAYINPSVDDGDLKRIEITIDGKKKAIEVKNMYQHDIFKLINIVNESLEEKYRMKYVEAG